MPETTCDEKPSKPHRRRQRADPKSAAERAAEAFQLSVRGLSVNAIAAKLGVSKATAHGYLVAGRQQLSESIQLDASLRLAERHGGIVAIRDEAWANYRASPDVSTLELIRKCEADLRKLFGDDAPTRQRTELTAQVESGIAFLPKDQMLAQALAALEKLERYAK